MALAVDDEVAGDLVPLVGVYVGDENVLQAQVEAFVFGRVREEEESPETQRDEGTEDEEEDELLGEPQGGAVMGDRRGPQVERWDPAPGEREQSRGGHV